MGERRICAAEQVHVRNPDPDTKRRASDGNAYSREEFEAYFQGYYSRESIQTYWDRMPEVAYNVDYLLVNVDKGWLAGSSVREELWAVAQQDAAVRAFLVERTDLVIWAALYDSPHGSGLWLFGLLEELGVELDDAIARHLNRRSRATDFSKLMDHFAHMTSLLLHKAAACDLHKAAWLLLKAGADPNATVGHRRWTPTEGGPLS